MEQLPEKIQKTAESFVADVRECFGERLRSVILYGPAARGEQQKGNDNATFMVVVPDNSPSELAPCTPFVKKWARHSITIPLFITPEYIRDSLDSFPLEFMEMRSSYRVIYGEDVLKALAFQECDIRNECEREIKGKLLHLRAEYLALRGDRKGLANLVHRSLNTFRLVFAGALHLKGIPAPEDTPGLLDAVTGAYGLDQALLKDLHALSLGALKPETAEADRMFDRYIEELDRLSKAIDTFCPSEGKE
jgi:hypothetical protein